MPTSRINLPLSGCPLWAALGGSSGHAESPGIAGKASHYLGGDPAHTR